MANEVSIKITSQDLSGPGFDSATARSKKLAAAVDGGTGSAGAAMESATRKAGRLGSTLQQVGTIASGVLAAEAIQAGAQQALALVQSTVQAATSLGESVNAVGRIFGDSQQEILAWGEANANAFGLSQRAFNQMATPLGAMLKNQGLAMEDVTKHTIKLTERAADMASVFNTDVSDALIAIQAGLRGESDPLEQYGVGLNAAAVEARALAETGKTTASALTEQEKALARLNIIYDQTNATAGDFQATSDGLANATRIMQARFEEAQAKIGTAFTPVMALAARVAGNMADSLTSMPPPAVASAAAIAALGAAALLAAPRIVATRQALDEMTGSGSRFERGAARLAVGTAKVAGGITALQVATALTATAIGNDLNPKIEALTKGLERYSQTGQAAGELSRIFGNDLDKLDLALRNAASSGKGMATAIEGWIPGAAQADESWTRNIERVEALDAALAELVRNGRGDQAAQIFKMLADRGVLSLDELRKVLPDYAAAMEVGATKTKDLGKAAAEAATDVDELTDSFRELIDEAFELEEAEDKVAEAVQRLRDQVAKQREEGEKGAGTLTGQTQAARDNRDAVRDLVRGYQDLITEYHEAGKPIDDLKRRLEDQLVSMGFSRIEAQKYAKQLDGITQALNNIPKDTTIKVRTDAQAAIEKIHETDRELRRLTSPTHWVYIQGSSPRYWPGQSGGRTPDNPHSGKHSGGISGVEAGSDAYGGWTAINERGNEMVRLPFGSHVTPAGQTAAMMAAGSAGLGAEIVVTTRGNDRLLDAIVAALAYEVRTRGGGNVQTYLGSYHGVPG